MERPTQTPAAGLSRHHLLTGALLNLSLLCAINSASALHRDATGRGQVLIYPYYTVNAGHASLLSLTNASEDAKALRLRFREALNGRAVVDINLYLGPFDMWTGAVVDDGEGGARLVSSDSSCTVPSLPDDGLAFNVGAYTGDNDDDGPNAPWRSREGFVEVIEMGVLADTNGFGFNPSRSYADAVAVSRGAALNCQALHDAWNAGGRWRNNPIAAMEGEGVGVLPPSGGVMGHLSIVDVTEGVVFGYRADALDGFYLLPSTTLHHEPGAMSPTLADAETSPGEVAVRIFAKGQPLDLRFVAGRPDAVSSVFMASAILTEFTTDPALGAQSEWVLTYPTKHLHIEQSSPARRRPFNDNRDDDDATDSREGNAVDASVFDPEGACVVFSPVARDEQEFIRFFAFFDRDAGPEIPMPSIADIPATDDEDEWILSSCWQTTVISLDSGAGSGGGQTELLGSRAHAFRRLGDERVTPRLRDARGNTVHQGWLAYGLADSDRFLLDGTENAGESPRTQLWGLPVTGLWVAKFRNQNAQPGVLADYAAATPLVPAPDLRRVIVAGEGTENERIEGIP